MAKRKKTGSARQPKISPYKDLSPDDFASETPPAVVDVRVRQTAEQLVDKFYDIQPFRNLVNAPKVKDNEGVSVFDVESFRESIRVALSQELQNSGSYIHRVFQPNGLLHADLSEHAEKL